MQAYQKQEADRQGGIFPPERSEGASSAKTGDEPAPVIGAVKLRVWQGQDPSDKHWGCPIRERWALPAHQQMSPALAEKLAFTTTLASSYAAAAQVAGKWGCKVDDSVIHALVQRVGSVAVNLRVLGGSPFTYQWQFDGTNLPGATGSSITVSVSSASLGSYSVIVSNVLGVLNVGPAFLQLPTTGPPILTDSPIPRWTSALMALGVCALGATALRGAFRQRPGYLAG